MKQQITFQQIQQFNNKNREIYLEVDNLAKHLHDEKITEEEFDKQWFKYRNLYNELTMETDTRSLNENDSKLWFWLRWSNFICEVSDQNDYTLEIQDDDTYFIFVTTPDKIQMRYKLSQMKKAWIKEILKLA